MAEYNCKFFPSSLKSHVPSFPAPDFVSIHLHIPSASSPTCPSALQLAEITLFVMITDYIGSKPHLTDGGIPVVLWWPPGIWAGELLFKTVISGPGFMTLTLSNSLDSPRQVLPPSPFINAEKAAAFNLSSSKLTHENCGQQTFIDIHLKGVCDYVNTYVAL